MLYLLCSVSHLVTSIHRIRCVLVAVENIPILVVPSTNFPFGTGYTTLSDVAYHF